MWSLSVLHSKIWNPLSLAILLSISINLFSICSVIILRLYLTHQTIWYCIEYTYPRPWVTSICYHLLIMIAYVYLQNPVFLICCDTFYLTYVCQFIPWLKSRVFLTYVYWMIYALFSSSSHPFFIESDIRSSINPYKSFASLLSPLKRLSLISKRGIR